MDLHLKLIAAADHEAQAAAATPGVLALANHIDVAGVSLEGVERIDLHFPNFADGRAFSQAFQLRRRRGFAGEIRATGDVLRADQNLSHVARQFARFERYYQGDAVTRATRFQEAAAT